MSAPNDAPTRGERNNNPGNIVRDMTPWLGLEPRDPPVEERFCVFDSALHGIRALCKVLLSYQRLDGCRTLTDVIRRWAPPTENDTGAYLTDVVARAGIGADMPLDLAASPTLVNVAKAIIHHENGRCIYADNLIAQAASMALTH